MSALERGFGWQKLKFGVLVVVVLDDIFVLLFDVSITGMRFHLFNWGIYSICTVTVQIVL